jgi:hypothetical protein
MLPEECEVVISFVAIVARKFMHNCHPGQYFRSKQLPNLDSVTLTLHSSYD